MIRPNCINHTLRVLGMLSPILYRMCSTSLRQPNKIFAKVPLPPLPWPKPTSPTCTNSSSVQWKEAKGNKKTLPRVLSHLQQTLRSVHRRKVAWPDEESIPSNLPPSEYLMTLLRPVVGLFNQLHSPGVLKIPMECIRVDFGDTIYGVTFTAEDFKFWRLTAPIILALPDGPFNSEGKVSPQVEYALSKALEYNPSVPSILVTNFKDIAVFLPPSWKRPEPVFERISTTQPTLALRVLSTAYLHDALPAGVYIDVPRPDMEVDENFIRPQGPPQDPRQPLLADDEVFETYHSHADFDIATLVRDRARALQFFRWHEHVQKRYSKLVARPDNTLIAATNKVGQIVPDIYPIYPFESSELPEDTTTHLKKIWRESPLVTAGINEPFQRSKSFMLKIQNVLSEGSERSICTVYRCQITSIDDKPMTSPSLCLKLFDDRFQLLESPDEDEEEPDEVPRWFDPVIIAGLYALNEAFAYDKLGPAQGSVVPWFYGTHQFTLSDGTVLYGILMEYIEGWGLDSDFARELSADRQIKMIQNCRHAARVLDVGDVSQRDWHSGEILLYANPVTKLDHAVLIDFASTTQTWEENELNYIHNYFGILRVLLGREGDVGFDPELVWKYFEDPDDWDPVRAWIPIVPRGNEMRTVKAKDMFPYILSA
ncbi:hypothetical protein BJ138DRAFT_1139528 [Hygrophoropsis aurantiaca]|uniref:Uncharacterized protein n=1 Tax=Hygrophoropsis aurantiaca TaxID=72124 RepID=A0ACB8AV19_9AGAM|nr:hypothetical protein BJ138DRAFT_1139528 [Hygrophoropsis aurantiaca]